MPTLKTLDLYETAIKHLPESVSNLKYLIALLLSGCTKLSHIPSLIKLKRLMSLDLCSAAITEAPVGLESLVNLRYLNLFHTDKLAMSISLISKLINLEHLELGGPLYRTDVTVQGQQGLEKLELVLATFYDINVFDSFVSVPAKSQVLESYRLTLQHKRICFKDDGIITQSSAKKIIFRAMDLRNRVVLAGDIKQLGIQNCCHRKGARSLCSVLSYGLNNNPHQIEELDVWYYANVDYLCCSTCPFCSSSQLVGRLCLHETKDLKNLMSPFADSLHEPTLFSQLTSLSIAHCNSMETLIAFKLLALLRNLRYIFVSSCEKMREIVGENHSVMEPTSTVDLMDLLHDNFSHPTIELPMLTSLTLWHMPQLDSVYRGIMLCPSLQTFFADDCKELIHPQVAISNNGCELSMDMTSTGYQWQK